MKIFMRGNLRIGYVPYSKDLQHPGDRRRIDSWARSRGISLEVNNPLKSDILVLSNAANFNYWLARAKTPVILDLVDGYLGEEPSLAKDLSRNLFRSLTGKSDFSSLTYTRALKRACRNASSIVVASTEQAELVKALNQNVHIILDDHSEFLDQIPDATLRDVHAERKYIFWEGFGFTLKHFEFMSRELDEYMTKNDFYLVLVTDYKFPRWGGKVGNINTNDLIQKWFPKSVGRITIVPWSISNVVKWASKSIFGVIPIDTEDRFANLKSENKLLSMWQLGLPVVFSDTSAYRRLSTKLNLETNCVPREKWGDLLASLDLDLLHSSKIRIESFLSREHTRNILNGKWDEVIYGVIN